MENHPQVQPFIYGAKSVIIACILGAVFPLAKKSITSSFLAFFELIVLVACLLGVSEIILLFGAGFLAYALFLINTRKQNTLESFIYLLLLLSFQSTFYNTTNRSLF